MAGETPITVIGNLTADPELRFTPSGSAVANFTIASTPRRFDKQTSDWKDQETLFMHCSIWREAAENVSETFTKGMRVVAQGNLQARSFEDKDGQKRHVMEMDVQEVGPSMKYASAKVTRNERKEYGGSTGGNSSGNSGTWNAPAEDPWASSSGTGGFPANDTDEPPF